MPFALLLYFFAFIFLYFSGVIYSVSDGYPGGEGYCPLLG